MLMVILSMLYNNRCYFYLYI